MSASVDASAIFMKDEPNKIKNKINGHAFSGGRETEAEQREKGGNAEIDVSYQYLTFFLEDDDELAKIKEDYTSGKMLTGELKAKCIAELQTYVKGFQERRAKVTDEVVKDFMSRKKLAFKGNSNAKVLPKEGETGLEGQMEDATVGEGGKTKNQIKKEQKRKEIEKKKAEKAAAKGGAAA